MAKKTASMRMGYLLFWPIVNLKFRFKRFGITNENKKSQKTRAWAKFTMNRKIWILIGNPFIFIFMDKITTHGS